MTARWKALRGIFSAGGSVVPGVVSFIRIFYSIRPGLHYELSRLKICMNITTLSALVFVGSVAAGFLGSLTGLGGGVVIIPMLTLIFGVDIRYAIGASLISVIATSSGAAAAYVREGYSNVRVGMFLEIATSAGAIAGAGLATHVSTSAIAIVFGVMLLYSAASTAEKEHTPVPAALAGDRPLGER